MLPLIAIPLFLIILLVLSTPLKLTLKKDENVIVTVETVLFSLTILPQKMQKAESSPKAAIQNGKNGHKQNYFSVLRESGRALSVLLRKIRYLNVGCDVSFSYEYPLLTGGIFAILCPALVLVRNEIQNFHVFSLPVGKEKGALYVSLEISLFAVIFAAVSFLFHSIANSKKKGKTNAAGSYQ